MEENNTENTENMQMQDNNTNENTQEKGKEKQHVCNCKKDFFSMMLAAFLGGFLAIYFVADQVFDNHHHSCNCNKHSLACNCQNNRFDKPVVKSFDRENREMREDRAFERDFNRIENDFNRNFDRQMQRINKAMDDDFMPMPKLGVDKIKIKTEMDDDDYKIIVCLKAFDGDESKIHYNVSGRKLTVFGGSKIDNKQVKKNITFTHDFILPSNADIAHIKKYTDDNKLIIEVPLKNI